MLLIRVDVDSVGKVSLDILFNTGTDPIISLEVLKRNNDKKLCFQLP